MTGIASTKAFRRTARTQAPRIRKSERIVGLSVLLGILAAIFAAIAVFMLMTIDSAGDAGERREQFFMSLISIVGAAFFLASIFVSIITVNKRWRKRRAAADLAIERGWHYNIEWDPRAYPARLFRTGSQSWVENAAHLHEPRYIEVGNYTYMTNEKASGRREVGFIGIGLDRALPHMYLASTQRDVARAYIPPFKKDQRLSLEGDFDSYFHLYCPSEYERDALYVLTPDVMALMIDEAPGFDIEIVDDWLFVIARKPFDMADARVLDFAQRISDTLGQSTDRQSKHYADERSGKAAFIAEPGSRLRTGRVIATLIPSALTGAVWVGIAWASGVFQ